MTRHTARFLRAGMHAALLIAALAMPVRALASVQITSACEIDYPPFCIVDAAGRADGFSIELMRAALGAMGCEVTFRTGTWTAVRGWLERGEIQALPLVGRTPEREAAFDFTVPYMSLHGAIVVRKDTAGIESLEDLKGRNVIVMRGDNAEEFIRREDRGIIIHTAATYDEALRELSMGRHDAVVIQRLVALRLLQETGLANLRVVNKPIEGFRQDFCFAVKDGDRETLALLNEGLALVMADGTYRFLHAKWFAALELPAHRRIVVGGDWNYPPYEYLDEKGIPAGFVVDLTRAIAREMGIDVEIRLGPWTNILAGLATREIDVVQGMFYSPERDRWLDFTQPHLANHYVAVTRAGTGVPPATLADLKNKRIVVQRGDLIHDYLVKNGLERQITAVESHEHLLRELAEGKHDCGIAVRISALRLIEKNGWTNLVLGRQPFLSAEYCYAVPQNERALLAEFAEGLRVLDESGEYRRIRQKWLGRYDEERRPALAAVLRYVAMAVTPLALLLLVIFLWSWSLRSQVARRTEELRRSEEQFRSLVEGAPDAIFVQTDGRFAYVNSNACRLFGAESKEQLVGQPVIDRVHPSSRVLSGERLQRLDRQKEHVPMLEEVYLRLDGSEVHVEVSAVPMDYEGKPGALVFVRDITERRRAAAEQRNLQAQLIQAQKMESVGRLAGGVAHDFNNMLGVILGHAEHVLEHLPPPNPLHDDVQEIATAAKRSSEITQQLLGFARKQTIAPRVLDVNGAVERILKMLQRLIGEDINLAWMPGRDIWPVKVDPSQIDQILANLCINARDAIEGVGNVTIETENVTFDEAYCEQHHGFLPGEYVRLAVSDSGCGMDKQTMAHLFEPFFTTKGVGKGTGLGLATIYGIVRQN
ncbi:transporter substrate-binding domain-containing protein, partial [bacterium]|nr:transporter substrate-binding domain-containing protein [bacterium]